MPYDLFWHGDFDAFHHYMRKAQIEAEKRQEELDVECWLAGQYTRMALESVYHMFNAWAGRNVKKFPYPKEPISVTERRKKDQEAQNIAIYERLKRKFAGRKGKVGSSSGSND